MAVHGRETKTTPCRLPMPPKSRRSAGPGRHATLVLFVYKLDPAITPSRERSELEQQTPRCLFPACVPFERLSLGWIAAMEILHSVSSPLKKLLGPSPVSSACQWVSFAIVHSADQVLLLTRILVALSFRALFGIWPKSLNVIPFRVCAKDSYHEDPGVIEMRAMLRGCDGFDFRLDQQQRLPFPAPDYDPYDKVYLASYYHSLVRSVCDIHAFLLQYGGPVYDRINDILFVQKAINYVSTRVAVNIDLENSQRALH